MCWGHNGYEARSTGLGRVVAEEDTWVGEWTGKWVDDSPAEGGGWSQVSDAGLPVGGTRVVRLPRTIRLPRAEEAAA